MQFCNAQVYNFKIFNEDAGLPQLYIYGISQDKNDLLYMATGDGLAVYDSKNMVVLSMKNGLAENFISAQYIAKDGTIWLGHFQNGISYIKNKKCFKLNNNDIKNVRVTSITEDAEGNIYAGTLGKGVFKIAKNLTVENFHDLTSDNVTSLLVIDKNRIAVGSSEGASIYDINKKFESIADLDSLEDIKVSAIKKDAHNNILVATFTKGILVFKNDGENFIYSTSIYNTNYSNDISDFIVVGNEIWCATFGGGVVKYKFKNNEYTNAEITHFGANSGLTNLYIQSIFNDAEGNVWMGSYGGGLFQLINEKFVLYNNLSGINYEDISALVKTKSNHLFLGGKENLVEYDLNTHQTIKIFNAANGFVNDAINALFLDDNENLWIGTSSNGIYFKANNSNAFVNISKKYKLNQTTINCFAQNKNNNLFIGTSEGLVVLDLINNTAKIFTTTQGLTHNVILNIFIDSKDRVWFACHGSGPFFYKDGEFTVFKDIVGLKSYDINSISEDKSNTIWITSEGDGVFKFDGNNFVNYRVEQGLASNYCYSISVDNNNGVWVGNKNGVSYKKVNNKNFTIYNKFNGYLAHENNLNAIYKEPNGNLWFGTEKGVIQYNANTILTHDKLVNTIIYNVVINDKIYDVDVAIDIKYKKYQIKFNVIAVLFSEPTKARYRYILEGYETKWNEAASTINGITYPKIEDGNYTFKIHACNQNGDWNPNYTTIQITIAKPFWKTSWFLFLVAFCFVISITMYNQYRTRALLKRQKELEVLVDEKTVEVRSQNELLEVQKNKLEVINHEITDSITYAKRIQEAMLPTKMMNNSLSDEVFIFFSPRDIVSGDFYWLYPYSSHELLIAAADCTGHGVPGAFLTMMGTTLLNKIIKDFDITTPSEILLKLDENVRESLHQNTPDSTKDGMDVAICKIDKERNVLSYSGACRPLIHIRNKEITEYRPSFYSIGYYNERQEKSFENFEIPIIAGDMAYIFSDGYADQFGGEKKTKFMSKKLKELLVNISHLPMKEQQQQVADAFFNWKGNYQQTDDILLIGIKL